MAAHIGQPTRSRRFIKVYLITWGLLAVGALGYLAMLAFPPRAAAPQAGVDSARSEAPKVLAEVRSLEGNLSEVRKDVTELQDAMGEREANEKTVNSRLTALEERVATIDPPEPPAAAQEGKLPDKMAQDMLEPHTTADILAKTKGVKTERPKAEEATAPPSAPKASTPPAVPIETGSITSKSTGPKRIAAKEEIIFGEAIVKPATQKDFAVQLAAGPSLQVLRQSWGLLVERHRASLAELKPRVVAPRNQGGVYRLLAGPVPTKADADRICTEMGAGPKACFATPYAGAPLEARPAPTGPQAGSTPAKAGG